MLTHAAPVPATPDAGNSVPAAGPVTLAARNEDQLAARTILGLGKNAINGVDPTASLIDNIDSVSIHVSHLGKGTTEAGASLQRPSSASLLDGTPKRKNEWLSLSLPGQGDVKKAEQLETLSLFPTSPPKVGETGVSSQPPRLRASDMTQTELDRHFLALGNTEDLTPRYAQHLKATRNIGRSSVYPPRPTVSVALNIGTRIHHPKMVVQAKLPVKDGPSPLDFVLGDPETASRPPVPILAPGGRRLPSGDFATRT